MGVRLLTSQADFYARRDLNLDRGAMRQDVIAITAQLERAGATWVRLTLLTDDQPDPAGVLPHGLYAEGWKVKPDQPLPFAWPKELLDVE